MFEDYVRDIYHIKSTTTNPTEKATSKSLLNNLLGRFGLNIYKGVTKLVNLPFDSNVYNKIVQTMSIESFIPIGDHHAIVSYVNKISRNITRDFNVDSSKSVINGLKRGETGEHTFLDISIAVASAVTAYARIAMSKIKLDILKNGGSIYYTDTDSIVTNVILPEAMVGPNLGQFKLESVADVGYFISNKLYFLRLKEGGTVVRAKGTKGSYLLKFIQLYSGKDLETFRTKAYRSISGGYVNIIHNNKVTLANKKREKVYVNGAWVDTKPKIYHAKPLPPASCKVETESKDDSTTT